MNSRSKLQKTGASVGAVRKFAKLQHSYDNGYDVVWVDANGKTFIYTNTNHRKYIQLKKAPKGIVPLPLATIAKTLAPAITPKSRSQCFKTTLSAFFTTLSQRDIETMIFWVPKPPRVILRVLNLEIEANDPAWSPGAYKSVPVGTVEMGLDNRLWQVTHVDAKTQTRTWKWQQQTRSGEFPLYDLTAKNKHSKPLYAVAPKWASLKYLEDDVARLNVVETGQDGNCFFSCWALLINKLSVHNCDETKGTCTLLWTVESVRQLVANQITVNNVDKFLKDELSARRNEFRILNEEKTWSPQNIQNLQTAKERVKAVRDIIETMGNTYWGETNTLQLLLSSPELSRLKLGCIVFQPDGIYPSFFTDNNQPTNELPCNFVCLYWSPGHWRVLNVEDQFVLNRFAVPECLTAIFAQIQATDILRWKPIYNQNDIRAQYPSLL